MVDLYPGESIIRSEVVRPWTASRSGLLTLTTLRLVFEVPRDVMIDGVNVLAPIDTARGKPLPMRTLLVVPRTEITVHKVGKPLFGNARWLVVGSDRHQGQYVVANVDDWLAVLTGAPPVPSDSGSESPSPGEGNEREADPLGVGEVSPPAVRGSTAAPAPTPAGMNCALCGAPLVRLAEGDLTCPRCQPPV